MERNEAGGPAQHSWKRVLCSEMDVCEQDVAFREQGKRNEANGFLVDTKRSAVALELGKSENFRS